MSFYPNVTPRLPDLQVDVGWDHDRHTYFVQAFITGSATTKAENVYEAGYDEPFELRSLYDLVASTWTLIDWPRETGLLSRLRDDPIHELRVFLFGKTADDAEADTRPELAKLMATVIKSKP